MQYKTLASNIQIPVLGFGVFQMQEPGEAKQAVYEAIQAGYRLIDTAASYGNEREVGQGIARAIQDGLVARSDLFITSKMWVHDVTPKRASAAIEASLERLQLDYLDLYLIHQPYNDVFAAWRAMEEAYKVGKLKAIGVSNFDIAQLTNLAEFSEIKPMVNQIEVNPFEQNRAAVDYFESYDVQVEAWAPFAEGKNDLFKNPTLQAIGNAHGKSIAQVILRWLVQRDIVVLAKSSKPERMQQNLAVLDFELSNEEMNSIQKLDLKKSMFFDHADPKMIQWMAGREIKY